MGGDRGIQRAVNMERQELDIDAKIDILKHVMEDQRGEVQYRREREYRIFTWSSNILLALIGALLVTRQPEGVVWKSYGGWGNIVASAAVVLIVAYSAAWQLRNSKYRGQNA
jgi:lipopolysaccharide export LptBFGC system permease protein LptF